MDENASRPDFLEAAKDCIHNPHGLIDGAIAYALIDIAESLRALAPKPWENQ